LKKIEEIALPITEDKKRIEILNGNALRELVGDF